MYILLEDWRPQNSDAIPQPPAGAIVRAEVLEHLYLMKHIRANVCAYHKCISARQRKINHE
jgi:hypothetical protein